MASSIAITASLQRACSPQHVTKKQQPQARPARSMGTKQQTHVLALETEGPKDLNIAEQKAKFGFNADRSTTTTTTTSRDAKDDDEAGRGLDAEPSAPKFSDERWKNGTWDLSMFVRDGKMDWDGVIVAEARRRKFLEMYPESATNQEPVIFRSSIIPWWGWMMRSHLPEAELINGRAAMVGFFMAYLVDALTGLDVVGQTGNLICKAGLLVSVMGVIFFRRAQDFDSLRKLAEEATLYDKQWQSSWQDQDAGDGNFGRVGKKI